VEKSSKKKTLLGTVTSDKMDKVITVKVELHKMHPVYKKSMIRHKKYKARDAKNEAAIGDVVKIREVRPLTKNTNWALVSVVEKAQRG